MAKKEREECAERCSGTSSSISRAGNAASERGLAILGTGGKRAGLRATTWARDVWVMDGEWRGALWPEEGTNNGTRFVSAHMHGSD